MVNEEHVNGVGRMRLGADTNYVKHWRNQRVMNDDVNNASAILFPKRLITCYRKKLHRGLLLDLRSFDHAKIAIFALSKFEPKL